MVINSQDQETAESALLRTEVALSDLKVSSHGDEDSIVKLIFLHDADLNDTDALKHDLILCHDLR